MHTKNFLLNCKIVFTGKIHPETCAYIKYNKNTPVIDLMKAVEKAVVSKKLRGPAGVPEKLTVRDKKALLQEIKDLQRKNRNWTLKRLMESVNVIGV